jgi:amino acid adenylation domain-containing protein
MSAYMLSSSTNLLYRLLERRPTDAARTALEIGGQSVSYARLAALSERLAAALAAAGIGRGDRVGIYVPKGLSAYVSIFAALRLGAAYVPLDPSAPIARIRLMVRDARLGAAITTASLASSLLAGDLGDSQTLFVEGEELPPGGGIEIRSWADAVADPGSPAAAAPAVSMDADDLAYILYTSGSTGVPKGVMISHRGASAFVEWAVSALGLQDGDRVAGVAELFFDLSVLDLFATLSAGATLVPLPPGILLRPEEAADWIAAERISVWYSTPSTLILLLEEGRLERRRFPYLKRVLFAGEVFPTKHLRRLRRALPDTELYNLYGPTETNVCTWYRVDEVPADDLETIPIGRPCAGTRVIALGADGSRTAAGEEGELWVQGPTVMRGYWDDPEQTARVLRPLPGRPDDGTWLQTGDLAHCGRDGVFHFHGRRDQMVKVRGYRVEPGEVETALYGHPDVREVAVVAVPDEDRGVKLRAWVVPAEAGRFSIVRLKTFLGQRLPAYMIPAEILRVAELPKTPSGKIDRRELASRVTSR